MQGWGIVCQLLFYQKTILPWPVKRNRENLIFGTETDIKLNPTAYLSVRNVSMHSLLIRYRRVHVPALRLWGGMKTRADTMTEVIAALIAPLRLYTVNAGTSIY